MDQDNVSLMNGEKKKLEILLSLLFVLHLILIIPSEQGLFQFVIIQEKKCKYVPLNFRGKEVNTYHITRQKFRISGEDKTVPYDYAAVMPYLFTRRPRKRKDDKELASICPKLLLQDFLIYIIFFSFTFLGTKQEEVHSRSEYMSGNTLRY